MTVDTYARLHESLGAGRFESLAQAAFRVLRNNYHPPYLQRVARMVLAGSGKSSEYQHEVFCKCVAILDEYEPTPEGHMKALEQIAYEAYAQSTGGKTYDGRDMPKWDDLPSGVKAAWSAAVDAITAAVRGTPDGSAR